MYKEILAKALKKIKPATTQLKQATLFIKQLNTKLRKANILATAVIGGSTAKGTYLKGDHDVDIFVRFNRKVYEKGLSDILQPFLPDATRVHGSRDYFQQKKGTLLLEIVPVLAITNAAQAKNVTDVSPLHVNYVLSHLKQKPILADEIRLAKQFCKAAKVYGAESYINGFSGHVLDILVIRYGSFLNLLKHAVKWDDNLIMDPARHHKQPAFAIHANKRMGPMLLIDPVQPDRNAAAALSREKFERFKEAAQAFLEKPALKYFAVTPLTPARIKAEFTKQKEGKLLITKSLPLEGKTDTVATKLLKVHEHLAKQLTKNDFTLLDNGWEYDGKQGIGYFLVKEHRLPQKKEITGPPLSEKNDIKRFTAKHSVHQKGNRLYAYVKRRYTTATQLLQHELKSTYIQQRSKKISLI